MLQEQAQLASTSITMLRGEVESLRAQVAARADDPASPAQVAARRQEVRRPRKQILRRDDSDEDVKECSQLVSDEFGSILEQIQETRSALIKLS
mmetsp:Transcript_24882/g.56448  ORF Transcript_24882/g.56448 Transcript_24882/m.56448 type:complete len:94 (+) Transcript_24882:498-779(+)